MVRGVSSTLPAAPTHNPFLRIAQDIRHEVSERGNFPPGAHGFSARRTHQLATDPLPVLLSMYEEYGPVFTVRTGREVASLGHLVPEVLRDPQERIVGRRGGKR